MGFEASSISLETAVYFALLYVVCVLLVISAVIWLIYLCILNFCPQFEGTEHSDNLPAFLKSVLFLAEVLILFIHVPLQSLFLHPQGNHIMLKVLTYRLLQNSLNTAFLESGLVLGNFPTQIAIARFLWQHVSAS